MNNGVGLIGSYGLVFAVIGLATLLQKKGILGDEGARKFIHIGVSNWWILAMLAFDDVWLASIPPLTFILLNYISYKSNLLKAMERGGKGNLGTVYFPISLLILVVLSFGLWDAPWIGGLGILILGYGDGFAAIVGTRFGTHKLVFGKSLEGTLAMFVSSLVVAVLLMWIVSAPLPIWTAFLFAITASAVELLTPKGFDNLTVPLFVSGFAYFLTFFL